MTGKLKQRNKSHPINCATAISDVAIFVLAICYFQPFFDEQFILLEARRRQV